MEEMKVDMEKFSSAAKIKVCQPSTKQSSIDFYIFFTTDPSFTADSVWLNTFSEEILSNIPTLKFVSRRNIPLRYKYTVVGITTLKLKVIHSHIVLTRHLFRSHMKVKQRKHTVISDLQCDIHFHFAQSKVACPFFYSLCYVITACIT